MRWPDLVFIKELIVKSGMKWNDLVKKKSECIKHATEGKLETVMNKNTEVKRCN